MSSGMHYGPPPGPRVSEHNRETCAEHQINFKYKAGRQGLNNSHSLRMTSGNQLENTMLMLHNGIGSTIFKILSNLSQQQ